MLTEQTHIILVDLINKKFPGILTEISFNRLKSMNFLRKWISSNIIILCMNTQQVAEIKRINRKKVSSFLLKIFGNS